jgi:hypothetical protein
MSIMSQEGNGKQKVSENNRPYATQPQPPRSGLVQPVIYRSAFVDINIGKGRLQGEGRSRLLLVLCLNLGRNIHLPFSKKKQWSPQNGWAFLSMFGSSPR